MASPGMRKYSVRAIYMQRKCKVKCVKDETYSCMYESYRNNLWVEYKALMMEYL